MKLFTSMKDKGIQHEPSVHDDVLWQNEVLANRHTATIMCCCGIAALVAILLTAVGIFTDTSHVVYRSCISALIWMVVPSLVCFHFKCTKRWMKYLLLVCLIVASARVDCGLGYIAMFCMLLPVVFSIRYYSFTLTLGIAAITTVVFAITTYWGAATNFTPVDLNLVEEGANYASDVMVYSFLPKWLIFILIAGVCAQSAKRGRAMVFEQARISHEHSRVETELQTASQIQLHALPVASELTDGKDVCFDLATSIIPAKEVGGDFYDFFYIDPTHLALVIADVSGKGVPAALFMMISKVMLDSSAQNSKSPAQVLTAVNRQLCKKNEDHMFVTVWLGVLDLTSGELISANAGHENPIVCHADGSVDVIKTKHGMVLGAISGVRYRDDVMQLQPGDTLFVYTDGIPEAHNVSSEMYGMDRLVAALKNKQNMPLQELVDSVQRDVDAFVGKAPQFDDSTMLALRMKGLLIREGIQVHPDYESIVQVKAYVEQQLGQASVPTKCTGKIKTSLDELYSNIVHYSGATWAEVVCHVSEGAVTVVLRDNGMPYDPTSQALPNTSLGAMERRIGGLGIFMARKLMDEITYQHVNGCNEVNMFLRIE